MKAVKLSLTSTDLQEILNRFTDAAKNGRSILCCSQGIWHPSPFVCAGQKVVLLSGVPVRTDAG